MSMTRVQDEQAAGQGLESRKRGLLECDMRSNRQQLFRHICEGQSTLGVIVLPGSCAGIDSQKNSQAHDVFRELDSSDVQAA